MRILLVEDDEHITEVLRAILAEQNYVVDVAPDGQTGWEMIEVFPYNLVILDVMLPRLDGINFCRRLRERKNQVLVMLLTARDTTTDKMMGLDAGADDYVVKPFNIQELVARIRALLRRSTAVTTLVLQWGDLKLNPTNCEVTYDNQPVRLSRKEYCLVELLLRHPQRVFSRSAIIDQLWSIDEEPPDEGTVKSHIKSIRQKLKAVGAEDLIETLYGQGYRLKVTNGGATVTKIETEPDGQPMLELAVVKIWQRTKGATLERLADLEQVVTSLGVAGFLTEEVRQRAVQTAHKLVGSLGTFGFDEGSRLARQLETQFQQDLPLQPSAIQSIQRLMRLLAEQLHGLNQSSEQATIVHSASPTVDVRTTSNAPLQRERRASPVPTVGSGVSPPHERNQPLLLVIDADRELAQTLVSEAVAWNFQVQVALDLASARACLQQAKPDVVLLDIACQQAEESSLAFLQEIVIDRPSMPILVFSEQDSSIDRVSVVRSGGHLFLQKPATPREVFQVISCLKQQSSQVDAKIVALDDDPQVLLALKGLLEPWGMQVNGLGQPAQLWDMLKSVQPDLLVLDIVMPEISGLDLCQSIRNDPQWNWLPIVFLTACSDADTIQQVFSAGADDYVAKPIVAAELVTRVLNRLERAKLLRNRAEIDTLTGISNRQRSTQDLTQFLQLAQRVQQPVCLSVLDLDGFKQVNDRYGYAQGDRLLRQFAHFLRSNVRSVDVVARWSGDEFVVGMYGSTCRDSLERLAVILEKWRLRSLATPEGTPIHLTFSAGIAQYPNDGTDVQMLYRTADASLYRAKLAGGDRVLPAGWRPKPVAATTDIEAEQFVDVTIVDSDPDLAQMMVRSLETRGYYATCRDTGRAVITSLKTKNDLKTKVLLVASQLTDMGGFTLVKRLGTSLTKQIRVVMLLHEAEIEQKARSPGVFDYVLMPCDPLVVVECLRRALED